MVITPLADPIAEFARRVARHLDDTNRTVNGQLTGVNRPSTSG
jgi:hypothetical protein